MNNKKKVNLRVKEKILGRTPLVVKWMNEDKKVKKTEVEAFREFYSDIYEWTRNSSTEEVFDFLSQHKEDKFYGEYVKEILTPKGREYLEYLLKIDRDEMDVED